MNDYCDVLAEKLGGRGSSIKGFTHGRILRGIAQNTGRGVRRELARDLNISAATVSKALAQQAELGLVRALEDHQISPPMGRPQTPLALTRDFAVIGIAVITRDGKPEELLGKVAALDGTPFEGFNVARRYSLKEESRSDEGLFAQQLKEFAAELAAVDVGATLLGCGITISGHVDNDRGTIKRAFHTGWGRKANSRELQKEVEQHINIPVSLENDVSSLAIRNNLRPPLDQASKNYGVVAVIDRGVGGAIVADSVTWPGAHGMSGEPGHIPALRIIPHDEPNDPEPALKVPRCQCGELGHVEAFASPRAIEGRAVENGLAEGRESISAGELAARPRSDELTSLVFYQGGTALGCAIVSLINWFDPENVLVYLPTELYETNTWLAGSRYVEGLHYEINKNSFIEDAEKLLVVNPTTDDVMQERLTSAAGYLVFRRLIRAIQKKRPSR